MSTERKGNGLDFIIRERGFELDFSERRSNDGEIESIRSSFENDRYGCLYDLGFKDQKDWFSPSLKYLHSVASSYVFALSRMPDMESLRGETPVPEGDEMYLVDSAPFIPGSEFITVNWVRDMWKKLHSVFVRSISSTDQKVEMYITEKNGSLHVPGRIFFHLVENSGDEFPFAFMATYSPENGGSHLPLRCALDEYRNDRKRMVDLLSSLTSVSERSAFIGDLMDSGELFHPLGLDKDEAFTFLSEILLYEECGILCRVPNWWRGHGRVKIDLRIDSSLPSVNADSLMSCDPAMYLDGQQITKGEVGELLRNTEGLALLKGRWVEADHAKLRRLLERFEEMKERYGDGISLADALKPIGEDEEIPITNGEWLSGFVDRIKDADADEVDVPDSFVGELRPYQKKGLQWMESLDRMGFGSCLADDMGLGKTIQVLALLDSHRGKGEHTLLVAPASLLGNWQKEASRFTPELSTAILHTGSFEIPDVDLVITTYGMVLRRKAFSEKEWDRVILDEAQAIKNAEAKQTKAVKGLKCRSKIILTGTPVENKLSDLWSLFDFINPGFLGTSGEFESFTSDMIQNNSYSKLRNMISPFILRRMKTDRNIVKDLPSKLETDEFITLSKKQTILYKEYLEDFSRRMENSDSRSKLGIVLSAIGKFKQICNHPDQYLGQNGFIESESGKFVMLRQICETIRDNREKVLVFTQYKEMTAPLSSLLEDVFGRKGSVFHGGMSVKERNEAVTRFNSEDSYVPYMVISLKAGGVGLNLTSANHVIHFDRWWNPAVENQATDRAFRIGQKKDVVVHRFICRGTLEERIDELIHSKKELTANVLGTDESWLAKMDRDQLMDLFRLE